MSNRNIPGFTAEDSLYIGRTQYSTTTFRFLGAEADIRPQIRRWPMDDCIPGCVCASPINCPCCSSIGWPPWPTEPMWPLS
jgi:hypothetical protein